ncbi:MAG TPA: hypothetical protein VGD80_15315 [Kofleriaceae bacterium]
MFANGWELGCGGELDGACGFDDGCGLANGCKFANGCELASAGGLDGGCGFDRGCEPGSGNVFANGWEPGCGAPRGSSGCCVGGFARGTPPCDARAAGTPTPRVVTSGFDVVDAGAAAMSARRALGNPLRSGAAVAGGWAAGG